jgi:hypothetical protein
MPPPIRDPREPLADPATLPRGLIKPPQEVLDVIAREKVERAPYYTRDYEILTLNDMTLAWYFEHYQVAYRPTPEGPEVLAVEEEIADYVKNNPPEQRPDVIFTIP